MQFKNRPNRRIVHEGREYWISRAMAVVAIVITETPEQRYVLLGKRGKGTPDFQGYWCLPCGYLDWDESGTEAVLRELYEETGLEVPADHAGQLAQPWQIDTNYSGYNAEKQNVTMRYALRFQAENAGSLPPVNNLHCEPDEVDEVQWVPLEKAIKMDLAFRHQNLIKEYAGHYGLL